MNIDIKKWLINRASMAAPNEVCGFILKDGSIVEIPNASHDPQRMFAMSREHLEQRVPNPADVQAIWHSHPKGSLRPSIGDIQAMHTGMISPDWDYYIVTANDISKIDVKIHVPQPNSFWQGFLVNGATPR